MKHRLLTALVVVCVAGLAHAARAGEYCPPAERWVDVVETVQVQVPVTTYVDEPYEYKATRMVPVYSEVNCPQGRWVTDRRTVPTTRTVYENESYTAYEPRYEMRPETRTRRVNRTVWENETRTVTDRVYENICDSCGRSRRVARNVCRTVTVPVKRKVCVEEPYTVNVRHQVMVPVTKTRRVARTVPSTREVVEQRYVVENVRRKVTTMQPVEETRIATRKRAVCTTQTVDQQVVRRVRVPAGM